MRRSTLARLVVALVLVAATSCGGSSSGGSSKSNSTRNAVGECSAGGSGAQSCPEDEAYEKCVIAACDSKYQECFGPGYASGSYAGLCGTSVACYMACACGDTACETNCFLHASQACTTCANGTETCKESSGCKAPVCGGAGGAGQGGVGQGGSAQGGSPQGGSGGGELGGSAGTQEGGSGGGEPGGSGGGAGICPYAAPSMQCASCCDHLKAIAAKCKDDPNLSEYTKMVLTAAATGTGTGCKATCAVDSASYPALWACFEGVPLEADCTAIAGCTMGNCL